MPDDNTRRVAAAKEAAEAWGFDPTYASDDDLMPGILEGDWPEVERFMLLASESHRDDGADYCDFWEYRASLNNAALDQIHEGWRVWVFDLDAREKWYVTVEAVTYTEVPFV